VVVGLIVWVVSLLLLYLSYLVCLEPWLGGRTLPGGPYTQHRDVQEEQEEQVTAGTVPMAEYDARGGARSVVNRIGVTQDRWRRQVETQRSCVYDRHTLLN
jgi:hypothetical protein